MVVYYSKRNKPLVMIWLIVLSLRRSQDNNSINKKKSIELSVQRFVVNTEIEYGLFKNKRITVVTLTLNKILSFF